MKPLLLPLLLGLLLASSGCASRYDMLLRNNQVITAKSKPKEDGRGNYLYTDVEGKKTSIPVSRVMLIEPRPFWGGAKKDSSFKFIPAN